MAQTNTKRPAALPTRRRSIPQILLCSAAACIVAGCGPAQDGPYDVWGTVTFAGESVADGAIYFVASESEEVLGFAKISGGRYQARVRPGPTRVRITADQRMPGEINEAGNPLIEQYVPARFNEATQLGVMIDRRQRLDWRLPGDG